MTLVTILAREMRSKFFQVVFFFFFFFFFFLVFEDGPVVYPANAFDSRLRGD